MKVVVLFLTLLLNALPPHDVHVLYDRQNWEGWRFDELCVWRHQQPQTLRCLRMRRDGTPITDADVAAWKAKHS